MERKIFQSIDKNISKKFSVRPRVGSKCGIHISSAIQTYIIIGYRLTHDFLHLEDFRHSDVELFLELEFN